MPAALLRALALPLLVACTGTSRPQTTPETSSSTAETPTSPESSSATPSGAASTSSLPVLVDDPADLAGLDASRRVSVEGELIEVTVSGQTWSAPAVRLSTGALVRIEAPWDEVSTWEGRRARWSGTITADGVGDVVGGKAFALLDPAEPPLPLPVDLAAIEPVKTEHELAWHGPIGAHGDKTVHLDTQDRSLSLIVVGQEPVRVDLPAHLHRIRDVVFVNVDNDIDVEVVVLAELMSGVGPQGAVPYVHPVVFDVSEGKVTTLDVPAKVQEAGSAVAVYEALGRAVPDRVSGRAEALRCSKTADCTAQAPSERTPWAAHVLAQAQAGHLDLPWTLDGLTLVLGPGQAKEGSVRWFGVGSWYVVTPGPDGRATEPRWEADGD